MQILVVGIKQIQEHTHAQCDCGSIKLHRAGLEVRLITAVLIRPCRVYQLPVSCLGSSVSGGGGGRRRWECWGSMPSSTLANEASDFFSVANQLAASPPSPARCLLPSLSSLLCLLFFVSHLWCLIRHDRDYSFRAVLTLCMTMQGWQCKISLHHL